MSVAPEQIAALAEFRHEILRYLNFSKKAAEAHGVTALQYQALLLAKGLTATGNMTIGELAENLFTKHHATVELVDRMEAAGLLQRQVEETDRRRVIIRLTPEGESKLSVLVNLHLNELSHSKLAHKLRRIAPVIHHQ